MIPKQLFLFLLCFLLISVAHATLVIESDSNNLGVTIEKPIIPDTGWIEYISNDYNTTNRLTINSLMNFTMTNYSVLDQERPPGITDFYNGTHILIARPGDSYLIRLRYEAEPKVPSAYCEFYTYIDGAVGQLPLRAITFPRGVNVETIGVFTNFEYGLDTWYENGGLIQIGCPVGDVEFWDLELTIERLHMGRGSY